MGRNPLLAPCIVFFSGELAVYAQRCLYGTAAESNPAGCKSAAGDRPASISLCLLIHCYQELAIHSLGLTLFSCSQTLDTCWADTHPTWKVQAASTFWSAFQRLPCVHPCDLLCCSLIINPLHAAGTCTVINTCLVGSGEWQ